ncbi:MAG: vitamin K epoxide reductase family protein [Pseudobdellovibrionaceae bacterium]
MTNTKKFFYAALVTTFLSLCLQGYLAYQHYQLKLGLAQGPSSCNISATFNCDTVATSKYSAVYGIPLATLAVAFHAILLLLIFLPSMGLNENKERVWRYSFLLSLLSAFTSIIMGAISSLLIGTYCLYCMGAYVLSFANLYFLYRLASPRWAEIQKDLPLLATGQRWVLVMLLLIPGSAWLGNKMYLDSYGYYEFQRIVADSLTYWSTATPKNFNETEGIFSQTQDSGHKMTIVEFADFRCSHCRTAAPTLHSFVAAHPEARLILKPFPLDGTCNPVMERKGDGSSCFLASLAVCAEDRQKKGAEVSKWLFENQERWFTPFDRPKVIEQVAELIGATAQDLKACSEADQTIEKIARMAKEGGDAQIQGTPTVFVNNKLLERGQTLPVLKAVYSELMK